MRCLLDTHAVIWLAVNSPELSGVAKQAIFDPKNELFVSIVSAWEVAIKVSTGKLQLNGGVAEFFKIIRLNGFVLLPVLEEYVQQLETLPLLHRDPFDRMLIASAMSEGMCLLTADANICRYNISVLW